MSTIINNNDVEQSIEKIHVSNSRRRTKDGREFIYKNYMVSIPNRYREAMDIMDKIFLYAYGSKIHVSSVQPDGSVRAKRLSIFHQ